MQTRGLAIIAAVLLGTVRMVAHHAFSAEFDKNKPVELRGMLTKVEWVNPHAWIHVDVKRPDGKVESWMVEAGPPGALVRRGMTKNSVKPGVEVVVQGWRAKNGGLVANGREILLPDGHKLFVGSSGTGAPGDRPEK